MVSGPLEVSIRSAAGACAITPMEQAISNTVATVFISIAVCLSKITGRLWPAKKSLRFGKHFPERIPVKPRFDPVMPEAGDLCSDHQRSVGETGEVVLGSVLPHGLDGPEHRLREKICHRCFQHVDIA